MTEQFRTLFKEWIERVEGDANRVIDEIDSNSPLLLYDLDEYLQKGHPKESWGFLDRLYFYAQHVLMLINHLDQSESDSEAGVVAFLLGQSAGLMEAQLSHLALWEKYQSVTKSGRATGVRKQLEAWKRINILSRYIIEIGPPPDKTEFGKTNQERTRYFRKFQRESGLKMGVDTFNRYIESITDDHLEYVRRCIREAAGFRFIGTHYPTLRKDTKAERTKLHRQFVKETGHDVSRDQFLRWIQIEREYPGLTLRDLESRPVPY